MAASDNKAPMAKQRRPPSIDLPMSSGMRCFVASQGTSAKKMHPKPAGIKKKMSVVCHGVLP